MEPGVYASEKIDLLYPGRQRNTPPHCGLEAVELYKTRVFGRLAFIREEILGCPH
jgi:hypothetical protein